MDLIKLCKKYETIDMVKLHKTTRLDKVSDKKFRENLEDMYNSDNKIWTRLATILNAVFTSKRLVFILSRKILMELIKEDINSKYSSIGTVEYKELIFKLANGGFFERLREPKPGKAGVYKIIEPEIVEELHIISSKEYFEAQEINALQIYDRLGKKKGEMDWKEIKKAASEGKIRVKR